MAEAALPVEVIPVGHVSIDALEPHPENPRIGDIAAIRESIRAHGFYGTVVAQRSTSRILAGRHRWEAARDEGLRSVPVYWLDVDDDQARRVMLADNRSSDLATYDDQALGDLLATFIDGGVDLEGTLYEPTDLDGLLASIAGPSMPVARTDPDAAPELPAEPVSRRGDVWQLGEHRLLCGDSTRREEVAELLGDERPDLMVTDPPYGVAVGSDKSKGQIHGDLTQAVIPVSFAVAVEHLNDNARVYLFGGSSNWAMYAGLFDAFLRMQVRPIIWIKDNFVLRPNNYHSQFEMVYFGWKGSGGGAKFWFGDRKTSDVWQVHRDPNVDRLHPTQKPVEVCSIPIRNSCPPDGLVFDPFGGSGSTLIAAHRTQRRSRLIELDPAYVDVICRRYQAHTGTVPILEATGEPHDFTGSAVHG